MNKVIIKALEKASIKAGIDSPKIKLEHPEDIGHGDFSSNIAMVHAKVLKMSPKILADKIVESLNSDLPSIAEPVSVAGPGFINFKIKDEVFAKEILNISKDLENFGKIKRDAGKQIMVEYTDPNPFKVFHIGHLMANTIGESLSRLIEFSGADVIRACYQGDTGLHVAKTIWAIQKDSKYKDDIAYLGAMYVFGSNEYETNEQAKKEIIDINKKIFEKSDIEINKIYDAGRKFSLEYFDTIYAKLGTKFDHFFFEREVADDGMRIVNEFLKKNIFEKSDGAIVFPGEKYGEHTRVFINSQGLPTYEAKEIGLTKKKFELYPELTESIVVTANEQNAYFKVLLACMNTIYPAIGSKMKHLSHGILRPSTGKMSSRKGNIVSAEDLISEFESLVVEKTKERDFSTEEKNEINTQVAIAGLKYTILRQAIGGDIIYDPEKAVSFEGDSGPYLQYAAVRAQAIVNKAGKMDEVKVLPEKVELLEKMLVRFPETIERARNEYAPHHIITYLTELSSAFNSYYANNQIIVENDPISSYRINLTKVFVQTMKNGLWVLGIKVPKRM
jgi:arginyl-tRNA synthetase